MSKILELATGVQIPTWTSRLRHGTPLGGTNGANVEVY
jgi:hypothetical protein